MALQKNISLTSAKSEGLKTIDQRPLEVNVLDTATTLEKANDPKSPAYSAAVTSMFRERKMCKNGHYLDSRGFYCSEKGCKYSK